MVTGVVDVCLIPEIPMNLVRTCRKTLDINIRIQGSGSEVFFHCLPAFPSCQSFWGTNDVRPILGVWLAALMCFIVAEVLLQLHRFEDQSR